MTYAIDMTEQFGQRVDIVRAINGALKKVER